MLNRILVGLAVAAVVGLGAQPASAAGNPCYKARNIGNPTYLRLAFKELYPLTQPAEAGVRKKVTYSVTGLAGPDGEARGEVSGSIVVMRKLGAKAGRSFMGLIVATITGPTTLWCNGSEPFPSSDPSVAPAPAEWDCAVTSGASTESVTFARVVPPASDPKCGFDN